MREILSKKNFKVGIYFNEKDYKDLKAFTNKYNSTMTEVLRVAFHHLQELDQKEESKSKSKYVENPSAYNSMEFK